MNSRLQIFCIIILLISTVSCERDETVSLSEKMVLKYMTAQSLYYGGDTEPAIGILKSVYDENPGFTRNTSLYARALYYSGDTEKAVSLWESICCKEAYQIDAVKHLSRFYLGEGRTVEAEALLLQALSYSSEDPGLLYLLAETRIAAGALSDGLTLLEKAAVLSERECEIYLRQASLYQEFGYYDRAVEAVEKSASLLNKDHPLFPSLTALRAKLTAEIP